MKKIYPLVVIFFAFACGVKAQCFVWAGNDTSSCQQPIQLNAMPIFPGSNYVYQWSPATGLNNPNIQNPIADHVLQQQYIVTMTDTVLMCSASDTIIVSTLYPHTDSYYACSGDSVTLDIGPGYDSYHWQNYDDGTTNHTLTDTTSFIKVNGIGQYLAYSVANQGACTITHSFSIVDSCFLPQVNEVWPGDCNYDLDVSNDDFIYWGIAYGNNFTPRAIQNISWAAHPATISGASFTNGLNQCHADCDGNGVVDLNDTSAIYQNYALHHAYQQRMKKPVEDRNAPLLYLVASPDTAGSHNTIHIDIYLGTPANPVTSIYGISFNITFSDPSLINTGSYAYFTPSSWFGVPTSQASPTMYCGKRTYPLTPSRVDFAFTGIDHVNRGGDGLIGSIDVVTTDNISGIHILFVDPHDIHAIDFSQNNVPVSSLGDSIVLIQNWGIQNPDINNTVSLYPNPAKTQLNFSVFNNSAKEIRIADAFGRNVMTRSLTSNTATLDISTLPAGVYLAEIITQKGVVRKKIEITR